MNQPTDARNIGLRGIIVADTNISQVDGANGNLIFRGYHINDLAEKSSFEEVVYLLLYEDLPTQQALHSFSKDLAEERELPEPIIEILKKYPSNAKPMDILQATVPLLGIFDSDGKPEDLDTACKNAAVLIAKIPTIVAYWQRIRENLPIISPDPSLSHAANFLYMLHGDPPSDEASKDFNICLVLHAEHSFNASTFSARVVASTRAHIYAAMTAGIGALSGELHGGANTQVMKNLLEIGDPVNVDRWVLQQFEEHKRVMGMGHAVYKTMDPRAQILKSISKRLGEKTGENRWYAITKRIDEVTQREFKARKDREIYPNVDLYSPSVYYTLGIPPDLYTSIFAMSRSAGWAAHIVEEKYPKPPLKPIIYRPSSQYQGNYCGRPGCDFIPIEKR